MGLQGRLEDDVWDKLAQLSAPPRPAPQEEKPAAPRPRQTDRQRKTGKRTSRPASSRRPRPVPVQTTEQVEFGRRLSELRGLLRAMHAGNPVNGVTPGVTSLRLRGACALANWLRASGMTVSRKQEVELRRMVLELNLLVKRHPALLSPPTDKPAVRSMPIPRERRPLDVSKIPLGPESSRWFMDPVNSK